MLAYVDANKKRASYNLAERMPDRRQLLQFGADELERMATP
jgi:hypothetical protein